MPCLLCAGKKAVAISLWCLVMMRRRAINLPLTLPHRLSTLGASEHFDRFNSGEGPACRVACVCPERLIFLCIPETVQVNSVVGRLVMLWQGRRRCWQVYLSIFIQEAGRVILSIWSYFFTRRLAEEAEEARRPAGTKPCTWRCFYLGGPGLLGVQGRTGRPAE